MFYYLLLLPAISCIAVAGFARLHGSVSRVAGRGAGLLLAAAIAAGTLSVLGCYPLYSTAKLRRTLESSWSITGALVLVAAVCFLGAILSALARSRARRR